MGVQPIAITNERIEEGFKDEYDRLVSDGLEKFLAKGLALMLYRMYRSGYIRGGADRARQSRETEAALHRALGNDSSGAFVRIEDGRIYVDGIEISPAGRE